MVQDADAGFGGAFFIGYHGAAGDADAVLCHTYTPSVIYEVRVNGVRCSEATINAALLGFYGVPLLLVTGDRTTVEGVQAQMPWVRSVIVKDSIGNFAADSMLPATAQRAIRAAAEDAVRNAGTARLYRFDAPINLDVQLVTAAQAHLVAMIPGFERTASRSVRFTHDDIRTVFKAFVATWRLGATA
jgi:D-amino peptidase